MKVKTISRMMEDKLVAVVRGDSREEAEMIAEGSYKGGIKIMEITYTVPGASSLIEKMSAEKDKDWLIGAGTVLDAITARIAILSGAEFIVSPSFDKEVAFLCNRYQVPYIPGCFTAKEIVEAMEHGVDIVKLFPGNSISPSTIQAFNGPLPQANLMPSGGVNEGNVEEWLQKGAAAVSIGSSLYKSSEEEVAASAGEIVRKVQTLK
jgi:2-dehydro-3-deoxyphosphogluconate aldolase / (4S)-4-hydroxy-2-oxoglutarate aldolase